MSFPEPISVGCPGACCALISLSGSYESLLEGARLGKLLDAARIIELMVPVDVSDQTAFSDRSDGVLYECRAFDRGTMRCTEYEKRPHLCSAYPYDRACEWCTFDPTDPTAPPKLRPIEEMQPRALETGIFDPLWLELWLLAVRP